MVRVDVRVRVRQTHLRWLRQVMSPGSAEEAIAAASEPDEDGWVETTIGMEHLEHAEHELLRFGADLEVLDPPELRERIATAATAMAAR